MNANYLNEINCMFNFNIKSKIVLAGGSKVLRSWQEGLPNLSEDMFIAALRWVCSDPLTEDGKLTREIGLTKIGIVKLYRHYDKANRLTAIRYEDGTLWNGDTWLRPCNNPHFADKDGLAPMRFKLSLSARDRV